MELEEGSVVLCTVERIEKTTVFVKIENGPEIKGGTIITSEIAPGRIRNLRDYVIPGKKIACKILSISHNNINLSLRRVTLKEKKEVMEIYQKEKNSLSILKSVLKEKYLEIAERIKKHGSLYEFLQECKTNPEKLQEYLNKEQADKICRILSEKKEKKVEIKKQFSLTTNAENGLEIIKKILLPYKDYITYISAGKFIIKTKGENYKKANQEAEKMLKEIELASKEEAKFEFKEK